MADKPYVCAKCLRPYTRRKYFEEHFDSPRVRGGGKNPCYKSLNRACGRSVQEAKNLTNTPTLQSVLGKRRHTSGEMLNIPPPVSDARQHPPVSDALLQQPVSDALLHPPVGDALLHPPVRDARQQPLASNALLQPPVRDAPQQPLASDALLHPPVSDACQHPPVSDAQTSWSIGISPSLEKTMTRVTKNQEMLIKQISKITKPVAPEKVQLNFSSNNAELEIRYAKDMETILNCSIVFDIFEFFTEQTTGQHFLNCKCCINPSNTAGGIKIQDPFFVAGKVQPNWFTNFKRSVIRHVKLLSHEDNVNQFLKQKQINSSIRQQIAEHMRHLSYFATKTAMPFSQFGAFLATVNRCGVDLGNINHSERYITEYTMLLDKVLRSRTEQWILSETDLTITLDIGTCLGMTLLAVLLIKGPQVRLMKITPATSKKGSFLASLCVDSLQSENISLEVLKEKIAGIVGDGAFIKGNAGFKGMMKSLLHEKLQFRWDILHLANRAHLDARGATSSDLKQSSKEGEEVNPKETSTCTPISRMIDMIQQSAKKLRHGINYTNLKLSTKSFKRPKVWSATRMCLYEFDMVHRFLQNKDFFDMPGDVVVLAIIYCIIMFAMKVMLKQCQKTTVAGDYVSNVITAVDGTGQKTMRFCLQVARTSLVLSKPCFNTDHIDLDCTESCHETCSETDASFPDLLSSDGTPRKVNLSEHQFLKQLDKFLNDNKSVFSLPSDIQQSFKDTRSRLDTSQQIYNQVQHVKGFIVKFWEGIQSRLSQAGLDPGVTCYSEAPAEGIFSVIENILKGRECLGLGLAEALTRVALEGPGVATMSGYDISKQALQLWKGSYGERFTTVNWMKGMKQKAMIDIQEGNVKKTKKNVYE